MTPTDNTEALQQNVVISCNNIVNIAQNALKNHPKLEKVTILEHAPRFDEKNIDPLGLKSHLAKFANSTLGQLWMTSPMKGRIMIGKHTLDCPDEAFLDRYRDENSLKYDGVHMYGSWGRHAFSLSLKNIFKVAIREIEPAQSVQSYHKSCPQTMYQNKQKTTKTSQHYETSYNVPVNNKFSLLGN